MGDILFAIVSSNITIYSLWAIIFISLGIFVLDVVGFRPWAKSGLGGRKISLSPMPLVATHVEAAKEIVKPTIEEDSSGVRRDKLGRVHSLKCSSCGGMMKRKRKAKRHPLAALFMLCLGVAFGLVGMAFNITLVGLALGLPMLIVGIIFFVIGVVWSFGIRRLWACLDCGTALERA